MLSEEPLCGSRIKVRVLIILTSARVVRVEV